MTALIIVDVVNIAPLFGAELLLFRLWSRQQPQKSQKQ
jgi:hypothetical protein